MIVIGISGIAESGKSSLADILHAVYGYRKIELGDGPKAAFKDLDGPTLEISKSIASRRPIQLLGTEMRQELGIPDHWIDYAKIKINYCHKILFEEKFVIPSFRYINEYDKFKHWVQSHGYQYFQIKIERNVSGLKGEIAQHSSETEVDRIPFDWCIINNSDDKTNLIVDLTTFFNHFKILH